MDGSRCGVKYIIGLTVNIATGKQPEIILELELETRAGTPLVIDPLDPLGLESKK
jgi:hypothetical protein